MALQLTLLTCGTLDAEQSRLTPGQGVGKRYHGIPIPAYLLRTDDRLILFDTGMPAFCYTGDPRALADEGEPDPPGFVPHGGADDTVVGQMAALGVAPADVDLVVNSHLHFDHCGGNGDFAHCPLLLQADELEAARAAPEDYRPDWGWGTPGLRYETIRGDHTLAPGVELLATPGHSAGHMSLLLRLPNSGPLLLTFDAVYTAGLWQIDRVGAASDPALARASMDRLRRVAAETGARVIFGHDPQQWATLRRAPQWYD
jgi:N-acyl homoserine lactone hydrolase